VETRRSIFETIRSSPGLHLRELSRRLKLQTSLVEYHVRELLQNDLIMEVKEGGYRRFYPGEDPSFGLRGFSSRQRKVLHFLRQDIPLRIVLLMIDQGGCTHKEILCHVPVGDSTLSYHLSRMIDAGIVERYRDEWGKGFRLVDQREVMWLMMRGRIGAVTVVDGLVDAFSDFY